MLLKILFSHRMSHYRGHVTPSQYQSVDLNLVIYKFFSIIVMPVLPLAYGKQSHVVLKMTLSQVY